MKRLTFLATFLALVVLACSPHPRAPELGAALAETLDAVKRSDFDKIWELTDDATRTELLELLTELRAAIATVPEIYAGQPEAAVDNARSALGVELVNDIAPGDADAGPKLLARMLSTDLLNFDPHAMDGSELSDVTIDEAVSPARAIVHTAAGERLTFIESDKGWRTSLIRDLLDANSTVRTMRENTDALRKAKESQAAAWRSVKDAKHPQGTYNLIRAAVAESPRNAAIIFTLLDQPTRQVVYEALTTARTVQREIQKRTVRKARRNAYKQEGLTIYTQATSDRDLYERFVNTDTYVPPVDKADDEPVGVEGDLSSGEVVVVTAAGAKRRFKRDPHGYWLLADHRDVLDRALGEPVRQRLERYRPK